MAVIDTRALISISEANGIGVSGLIKAADAGDTKIVTRGSKPVAAVISVTQLEALEDFLEDFVDVSIARARFATTSDRTYSLDEVLDHYGSTREELRNHPAY